MTSHTNPKKPNFHSAKIPNMEQGHKSQPQVVTIDSDEEDDHKDAIKRDYDEGVPSHERYLISRMKPHQRQVNSRNKEMPYINILVTVEKEG